jgi:hypothetical protein
MNCVEMRGSCDLIEHERVLGVLQFCKNGQDPEYD